MNKWEIQATIKDKWFVRGMVLLMIVSFLNGFFFGDTAHYIIPISAAFVAGICYLMYKSELADKLLNNYEIQPRTKRKKKKKKLIVN